MTSSFISRLLLTAGFAVVSVAAAQAQGLDGLLKKKPPQEAQDDAQQGDDDNDKDAKGKPRVRQGAGGGQRGGADGERQGGRGERAGGNGDDQGGRGKRDANDGDGNRPGAPPLKVQTPVLPKALEKDLPEVKPVPKAVEKDPPQFKPVPKVVTPDPGPAKNAPPVVKDMTPPKFEPARKADDDKDDDERKRGSGRGQDAFNPSPNKALTPQQKKGLEALEGLGLKPRKNAEPANAPQAPTGGGAPLFKPRQDAEGGRRPIGLQKRFEEIQKAREQKVDGDKTVIKESGSRTIIKQDNRIIIRHDEGERFRRVAPNARTDRRDDGSFETYYDRPDGVRVITITDSNNRIVRRYRRDRGGREFNIIDNRRFYESKGFRTGLAIGAGAVGAAILLNLAQPRVTIPRDEYIVDYDRASDEDIYETLSAPPVEDLDREYSLEEIRYNAPLRDRMRRIDLDSITFEFGSYEVGPDQYQQLDRVARAIRRVLERNGEEVFLIEGHTDAVGSDVDNLSLSDRRAESVAEILSTEYGIPPENLVTQGYGEQYLKVQTDGPERVNRRVAMRRITPLMTSQR